MTQSPFVVFSLPRSRSYWLSNFLSYGDWNCSHDVSRHFRSLNDAKCWLKQDYTGSCETGTAAWWRLLVQYRPDVRVAIVRRPVEEVMDSLERVGVMPSPTLRGQLLRLDSKLVQIARRVPNALLINYADLASEAGCARLFTHCLPYQHDPDWYRLLALQNLQCSVSALMRYMEAFRKQLELLCLNAKQVSLGMLMARAQRQACDLTIETESLDQFLLDGTRLFAAHSARIGELPDSYLEKNIPLHRALEATGALQVLTARSNGRMFGYLLTIIAPSLESERISTAIHTAFYASPDWPGLGLRLQRAAAELLRSRGVHELFFRAGIRADGPRLGVLARRLGAMPDGELLKLNLQET
jgi:hypothetical protein